MLTTPFLDLAGLVFFSAGLINLTGAVMLVAGAPVGEMRTTRAVYGLGLACCGVAFVMYGLADILPMEGYLASNLALVTGMLMLWWAVCRLFGRRTRGGAFIAAWAACAAVLAWFDVHPEYRPLRNAVTMGAVVTSALARAWLAWRYAGAGERRIARLMAVLLLFAGGNGLVAMLSAQFGGPLGRTPGVFALLGAVLSVFVLVAFFALLQRRSTAWLQRLAEEDSLTGALNRRAFLARVSMALVRQGEAKHLLMLDYDGFKGINDRYGHAAGDAVLRSLVPAARALLGDDAIVGRYGGEEFSLLLVGDAESSARQAEQVRVLVGRAASTALGHPVTVSAGLCRINGLGGFDAALLRADQALYDAKHEGRDRLVLAETPDH
ncbi:MAG: GGDEF domain-containing protein [Silanimonas sp.]